MQVKVSEVLGSQGQKWKEYPPTPTVQHMVLPLKNNLLLPSVTHWLKDTVMAAMTIFEQPAKNLQKLLNAQWVWQHIFIVEVVSLILDWDFKRIPRLPRSQNEVCVPYLPVHNLHLLPAKRTPKHNVHIYTKSFVSDSTKEIHYICWYLYRVVGLSLSAGWILAGDRSVWKGKRTILRWITPYHLISNILSN